MYPDRTKNWKKFVSGCLNGLLVMLSAGLASAQAPSNDNCSNAAQAELGYYYAGSTVSATLDGSSSCPDSNSPDVWFRFTPSSSTRVGIGTCYSTNFDSILSVHTACPGTAANQVVCDDDYCFGPGGPSYVEFDALSGQTYYVRISGFNDQGTPSTGYYEIDFFDLGASSSPTPTASPTPSPSPTGPTPTGTASATPTASPTPTATPSGVQAADNCSNAPEIMPDTVYSGTTQSATLDGSTTCEGSNGADVWLKFTPSANKTYNFNLCNVGYDAILSIHSACPGSAANTLACSDDGCGVQGGGGFASGPLQAGTTYYIRISGYNGAKGAYQFILEDTAPDRPEIQIDTQLMRFAKGKPKIHVEIDWMQDATHNFQPQQDVLNAITSTFAQAGYEIILEVSNAIPFAQVLNVVGNGPSDSPEIQAIKNAHFNHIGDSDWSYCIWGNLYSYNGGQTGSSGIADLPGNTFLVTLGSFPNGVGLFSHQVGTFVHEFGHTLGQKHGGIDHNNWKPNYVSIMNYFYQLDGITTSLNNLGFATNPTGFNDFGYSSGLFAPLDENNLNESAGIGLNRGIDWNCDGDATDTGVQKDIGGAGHQNGSWCNVNASREVLTDFDNWGDIANYIRLGLRSRLSKTGPSTPCISWDEYSRFQSEVRAKADAEGRKLSEAPTAESFIARSPSAADAPQNFTITNVGLQPLQITGITTDPPVTFIGVSPSGSFTIPPQSSQQVTVSVNFDQAPAGETTTRLLVASNDADENPYPDAVYVIVRNLTGGGATPSPTPSPTASPTPSPSPTVSGDAAELISEGIPNRMIVGTDARVAVNVRNIGATTWGAGYSLAVVSDPCGIIPFLELPVAETASGQTASFAFQAVAGGSTGNCQVQLGMKSPSGFFGPVITRTVMIAQETTALSSNPEAWLSGVVSGSGSVEANGAGLCTFVPDLGDNIAGWVSPDRYIPLADLAVYQVRVSASTTQTAVNEIPIISMIYDNFPYLNYGGELIVIDVADGANGIGRPQGRTSFEMWAAPNALATQQWRGVLPGGNPDNDRSMFTPQAEVGNDMRIVFRLLDPGSAGVNANIDDGTVCLQDIRVRRYSYDNLAVSGPPVWGSNIASNLLAAETFDQMGAGTAQIDDVNQVINYQLLPTGLGSRKTLIPFDQRPAVVSPLYPIPWLSNQLYRATLRVRSNVAGVDGTDPLDVLGINFDTKTVELVNTHLTLRGTPDFAHRAASPRLASTTGGQVQPYVAYFYSHNTTALPVSVDPAAPNFRAMGDFINFTEIAPDGTGQDAFTVTEFKVEMISVP